MVEAGIAQRISANSGVQALLGNPARVYPMVEPENPAYPCARYRVISNPSTYLVSGAPARYANIRIQVDSLSGGASGARYSDAKAAQAAIRTALDLFVGTLPDGTKVTGIFVKNETDGYGQDGRTYVCSTDFEVNYVPS